MSAQSNAALMRKGYDAFSRGDMEMLRNELLAPDIVWHQGGRNQTAGDYRGADEVLGLFGKLFQLTDGTFRVEIQDLLTKGNALQAAKRYQERTGVSLDDAKRAIDRAQA